MSGLTAPLGGGDNRIENVELIPTGFQLCTLFSLVDIGTQDTGIHGPKHKVRLAFEFPEHMRVFFENGDPMPSCIFLNETLSMNEKANLRKRFVQPMIAKVLSDEEAEKFDISTLLGKHFVANIVHSSDGKWANIESITPLNTKNMLMFGLQSPVIQQINPTQFFALHQGFESANFANIKGKSRDLIINSVEGKTHAAKGGKFAEPNNGTTNSTTSNGVSSDIVMIDTSITYEAYKQAGWTDEQLINSGKARRNVAVAPPSPLAAPAPSLAPAPPSAPAPTTPPPAAKPVLVFKDPNARPLSEWLAGGWTEEMIVKEGHASFQ